MGFIVAKLSAGQSLVREAYSISGIVLAAGSSSRMRGAHKLLLPFGETSVIEAVVARLLSARLAEVVVVVGYQRELVAEALARFPVRLVPNPNYSQGMASSLKLAIASTTAATKGFLVALGDMPLLSQNSIKILCEAFIKGKPGQIVAPRFEGRSGHPVLFCASYSGSLMKLYGDQGARSILRKNSQRVQLIAVDDPGIHVDVDTSEDYRRICEST